MHAKQRLYSFLLATGGSTDQQATTARKLNKLLYIHLEIKFIGKVSWNNENLEAWIKSTVCAPVGPVGNQLGSWFISLLVGWLVGWLDCLFVCWGPSQVAGPSLFVVVVVVVVVWEGVFLGV